ncbi:MAG: hypothetical protein E7591_00155 [Ruminococcaceae bacterium]|nr:hypothetical protein [Oscillospiraceae bacterium]
MLKFIVGLKGAGKTKEIVALANEACEVSNGSVVFIEKGNKLMHEVTHKVRLVDTKEFDINDAACLYGMVAGMLASNRDITHIYIDSALKICNNDVEMLTVLAEKLNDLSEKHNITIVATNSIDKADLPEATQKYVY